MAKRITGQFTEFLRAVDRLRNAVGKRPPFTPFDPAPATQEERLAFWDRCRVWQQRVAKAYGWRKTLRPFFVKRSVLAALFDGPNRKDNGEPGNAQGLGQLIGSPPDGLLGHIGSGVTGIAAVTKSDLRGSLLSVGAMLSRKDEPQESLSAEEMCIVTAATEHWSRIESYLRWKVLSSRDAALELIRWVEDVIKSTGRKSGAALDRESTIARALMLAQKQPELTGKAIAKQVGVSPSWLSKQIAWKRWRADRKKDRRLGNPEED